MQEGYRNKQSSLTCPQPSTLEQLFSQRCLEYSSTHEIQYFHVDTTTPHPTPLHTLTSLTYCRRSIRQCLQIFNVSLSSFQSPLFTLQNPFHNNNNSTDSSYLNYLPLFYFL